jgi:hypothetical protein
MLEAGPRFVGADEMHSINLVAISTVCWGIGIGGRRSDIVSSMSQVPNNANEDSRKRQSIPLSTTSFFREPFVQQTLVCSVETSIAATGLKDPFITFSRFQ